MITLLIWGLIQVSRAEEIQAPTATNDLHFTSIFTKIPNDYYEFGQRLLRPEEFLPLSVVAGSSVLLYSDDQKLWESVSKYNHGHDYKKFWESIEAFNGGYFQIATSGFFLSWGLLGNDRALRTSFQIARGILSSGIIVQTMKRLTGRESPNQQTQPRGHWSGYVGETNYNKDVARYDAVPSGHLQSALVTFVIISENYPEQKWIPWVGWPLMGLFTYSLPATNIHWWSDLPIAAYLGYSFGKIITRDNLKKPDVAESALKWEVYPAMSRTGNYLLTVDFRF